MRVRVNIQRESNNSRIVLAATGPKHLFRRFLAQPASHMRLKAISPDNSEQYECIVPIEHISSESSPKSAANSVQRIVLSAHLKHH
jgi:hypothetical protein